MDHPVVSGHYQPNLSFCQCYFRHLKLSLHGHLVKCEHAEQVHPQRELGHVGLHEGGDRGVAELEYLGHLLLPLVVLLPYVVVDLDQPVCRISECH